MHLNTMYRYAMKKGKTQTNVHVVHVKIQKLNIKLNVLNLLTMIQTYI